MKKLIYILLLGVILASCSKIEPLTPNAEDNTFRHEVKIADITDPDKDDGHDGDGDLITDPDKEDDHDNEKKIAPSNKN